MVIHGPSHISRWGVAVLTQRGDIRQQKSYLCAVALVYIHRKLPGRSCYMPGKACLRCGETKATFLNLLWVDVNSLMTVTMPASCVKVSVEAGASCHCACHEER